MSLISWIADGSFLILITLRVCPYGAVSPIGAIISPIIATNIEVISPVWCIPTRENLPINRLVKTNGTC